MSVDNYDVIIIGTGAGGGTLAGHLLDHFGVAAAVASAAGT